MHWNRNLLTAALMFAAGVAPLSAPALENASSQTCHAIDAGYSAVTDAATFSSQGEITAGLLQGTTQFTGDPQSVSQITGPSLPPVEAQTFSYTGDTVITTPQGVLTVRGVGAFERIPFGRGTLFNRVLNGTGIFQDASGVLYFNFTLDDAGNFLSTVTGEICTRAQAESSTR